MPKPNTHHCKCNFCCRYVCIQLYLPVHDFLYTISHSLHRLQHAKWNFLEINLILKKLHTNQTLLVPHISCCKFQVDSRIWWLWCRLSLSILYQLSYTLLLHVQLQICNNQLSLLYLSLKETGILKKCHHMASIF